MIDKTNEIVVNICKFLKIAFNVDANASTCLLGPNSTIDSLSVMELVAWCEETFMIEQLLEDDLFLDSLSSVRALANAIASKGGLS